MYDVGDSARLVFSITDVAGTPTNGTVVLTVTEPDGTTSLPTVSNPAVGSYTADVVLDQAGSWRYVWVSTGAVTASQADVLNVESATPAAIVSLAAAKEHLEIRTTTHDEELRDFIAVATDFVESRIGPVVRRTIGPVIVAPAGGELWLKTPTISVSAITAAYGRTETYTVSNYTLDGRSGRLTPNVGVTSFAWPVLVTYVAGRVVVPAQIRQAALNHIKWQWESQRGATPLQLPGGDFEVSAPATVPSRIMQALEPYMPAAVA